MLGNQIRTLRKSRNISQVTLAKALGVSKQSVSNWENDNIPPSIEMLKKIAIYFSCSTDYLLELDTSRDLIEITGLSVDQISHIQAIINDYQMLNNQRKL